MKPELLEILCCPVSRRPLVPLGPGRLERLQSRIADGEVLYVDGSPVTEPFDEALITDDRKVIYSILDGIPVLLPERGIGTAQFGDEL